jgi:hypothetical protein
MLKEGVIEMIIKIMKKNILSMDIMASSIDCIDGLITNELISVVVAEKESLELIIKAIRSQDWNVNVITKAVRVLVSVANVKQNIEQIIANQVPLTLSEILRNQ